MSNNRIEDSEVYKMFKNKDYHRWEQVDWEKRPVFIQRDNTIYQLVKSYYRKQWLRVQSEKFHSNGYAFYIPIATMEEGTLTSYIWDKPNMAKWLLDLAGSDGKVSCRPNLYWCDVGNHPYPKEGRFNTSWIQNEVERCCHRLVYPDIDIEKAVIFPSDL